MSNKKILKILNLIRKHLELHGENDFKIRTYQNTIQRLERLHEPLEEKDESSLQDIEGIGKSMAATIREIVVSGSSLTLQQLESETPDGIKEIMRFRGIGPKRLHQLWEEFNVTDKASLKELLESGQLASVKGFGPKTIESTAKVVDFIFESEGKILYADAEKIGNLIINKLVEQLPEARFSFVGKLRRKWEVIDNIEILADQPIPKLVPVLEKISWLKMDKKKSGPFSWKGRSAQELDIEVTVYSSPVDKFYNNLILKTGSPEHLNTTLSEKSLKESVNQQNWPDEQACYEAAGLSYCEPEIREGDWEVAMTVEHKLPEIVELKDLKGVIHNHSVYSDGQNTLREMAYACIAMGYDYLGISDHSKAASFYANGMFEETVAKQQSEIDQLNKELDPFKIFKGIEADILADGALDYDEKTLSTFDFVVASIHSGLNMDKQRATERLITAIANPYTTMLGHMTGRLLLERQAYPVDHEAVINACGEFGVIIEINAHPSRLDIDWRWIRKALDKGIILSINPDAHEIAGFDDMRYGVHIGRKGGLTKEQTFNAWSLDKVESYFSERRK
ncbi:MAG: PHP domain-containing protein [Bacteroidota bacterium]